MVNLDLFSSRLPNVEALKAKQDIKGLIRLLDRSNIDIQWQSADALGSMGTISHAATSCRAQPQENNCVT